MRMVFPGAHQCAALVGAQSIASSSKLHHRTRRLLRVDAKSGLQTVLRATPLLLLLPPRLLRLWWLPHLHLQLQHPIVKDHLSDVFAGGRVRRLAAQGTRVEDSCGAADSGHPPPADLFERAGGDCPPLFRETTVPLQFLFPAGIATILQSHDGRGEVSDGTFPDSSVLVTSGATAAVGDIRIAP